ncbi:MAG: hypothetical protein JNL69_10405 [Bacteroidia bacterium]|nr:hypothetical protein [Bacteroidia bacterium]
MTLRQILRRLFTLTFLFNGLFSYGQEKKFPLGVSVDCQVLKHQSVSLAFGRMSYNHDKYRTKCSWLVTGEYFIKDNYLTNDTYGFKFGGNLTSIYNVLDFGYALSYFTDFSEYKLAFTPEIGIGYRSIFLVYRRNLTLYKTGLDNLNKDNISLRLYIPIDKRWF